VPAPPEACVTGPAPGDDRCAQARTTGAGERSMCSPAHPAGGRKYTPPLFEESAVSKSILRAGARAAVVVAGVSALTLGGALAASAHVTVIPNTTTAGSYALLTFGVPHGCDGSSTTKVAIKIAEQINAVTPTVNPNWDVQKVMVPLNPAVTDSHGNQITERVDQVVYTAKTPLPDGYRDAFVLSLQVPDVAGQTLSFPTIQTCEAGETAWIEPEVEGQDEPDHPAPAFEVTAAAAEGDGHGSATTTTAAAAASTAGAPTSSAEVATAAATESGSTSWVAVAGLVAGVLGLVVGGIALARSRRA
jgi:periplasmic copper chaperone A